MGWTYHNKPPMGWPLDYDSDLIPDAGFWYMPEGSGGIVQDLSGNDYDGILTGTLPFWSAGKFGSAIFLPGTDEYISLGSSIRFVDGTTPFTFIWWENVHTTPVEHQSIAGFYPNGGSQLFFIFRSSNASYKGLSTGLGNSAAVLQWGNAPSLTDAAYKNVWRMWALVGKAGMNSTTAADWDLYIDGIVTAPTGVTNLGNAPDPANNIGLCGGINTWKGMLDLPSFYNRVLNSQEIALLHQYPFCMFKDPDEIAILDQYYTTAGGISMPLVMQQMNHFKGGAAA